MPLSQPTEWVCYVEHREDLEPHIVKLANEIILQEQNSAIKKWYTMAYRLNAFH